MHKDRRLAKLLPLLILWGVLAALFWSWIFTFLTDTAPENKITLYLDVADCDSRALAVALEEALPEGLKMAEVHPFSYAMFGGDALRAADLFVIRASDLTEHADWFAPLPESLRDQAVLFAADGTPIGVPFYDADAGLAAAASRITYFSDKLPEAPLYLCFGAQSVHLPGTNAISSLPAAEYLLTLK